MKFLPVFVVYLAFAGGIYAILFWPQEEVVVEQNAQQEEIISTAMAIERSANSLNSILLKTRAGLVTENKLFSIIADELKSHRDTLKAIAADPFFDSFESLKRQVAQIDKKTNEKHGAAMLFSQHHAQQNNSIKRAREFSDLAANVVVESGNIDAIAKLDLIYELTEALNNWANFNQKKDGDFILGNTSKLNALSSMLTPDQYKQVESFTRSLENSVREQNQASTMLNKAVSIRVINTTRIKSAVLKPSNDVEEEITRDYSIDTIVIILVLALVANIIHIILLHMIHKKTHQERVFLRNKTAKLIKRTRTNVHQIGDNLQDAADGFKHYQKLDEIARKISDLWLKRDDMKDLGVDEMITSLVDEYKKQSKRISSKELQRSLVNSTNELDEFDEELHEMANEKLHNAIPQNKLIAKFIEIKDKFNKKYGTEKPEEKKSDSEASSGFLRV